MSNFLKIACMLAVVVSCQMESDIKGVLVTNESELHEAIADAEPGDEIILQNGTWTDIQIRFVATGTESKPIVLRAQTPGQVFVEGRSDLKFGGEHLMVSGLHFRNGYTPSDAVIEFRIDSDQLANHCRLTNTVIEDFNQMSRERSDRWIQFWGRYNQLDRCYIAGKANRGPTVRIDIHGNQSIRNYHQIVNNHFGLRPPKGGPSAETIQLGVSSTSMSPSNTLVANNLFERCNGEVEVISSKSNYNEFRNNVFYKSEGSLVTRHGNYCIIDGNYFIGDENNEYVGGVRLINTGHWVTNNYFIKLKGREFRSPLAVMNGIPRSPLNRYLQVTDVVVAHNTWVNCTSPWQFGVGTNISQKDVLPPSEIRSARPIRTLVANNLIYNEEGDPKPLVAHDDIDGVTFKSNFINNQGVDFEEVKGLDPVSFSMNKIAEDILVPGDGIAEYDVHEGFDFETITRDLMGYARSERNAVGAISHPSPPDPNVLEPSKYGPDWYTPEDTNTPGKTISVNAATDDLAAAIGSASDRDILQLEGVFEIDAPLQISKPITLRSAGEESRAQINYSGPAESPLFEMNPKGDLKLQGVALTGGGSQLAFASLEDGMSSHYNLEVKDSEISGFRFALKGYKQSFAQRIAFTNTIMKNNANGIELSAETDDRGDYNAENVVIEDCRFENIPANVVDYYRGGYDESTVGGTFTVTNSTFVNCGSKEETGILLNTYGIINVDLSNNTFENNRVKLVARLWGAKNNVAQGNTIRNSGRIITEQNLPLKLMY